MSFDVSRLGFVSGLCTDIEEKACKNWIFHSPVDTKNYEIRGFNKNSFPAKLRLSGVATYSGIAGFLYNHNLLGFDSQFFN
jgi:hypothetical protein